MKDTSEPALREPVADNALIDEIRAQLSALQQSDLLRARRVVETPQAAHLSVDGRQVLSFCSNDYLGLASDARIIEAASRAAHDCGVGSGASALISGHALAHQQLEEEIARFVGAERALLFSTGYMANLGVIPALVGRGDAVFSDRLNHASIVDGARLSRAEVHVYPHLDVTALERLLKMCTAQRKLVVTDAVFSMDGDVAPLPQLLRLCERHRAWLLVDDAHGFGV
ncbi:MAG: aminotransferase class I/II-fold pyridoxal phosphate-dependent enzyme, partial [Burkholderiales bacterium]|nr:aminotransferase class I/II-fold pyridoxal phosphate-dependent enzyme [Burkholderiales bacterium]